MKIVRKRIVRKTVAIEAYVTKQMKPTLFANAMMDIMGNFVKEKHVRMIAIKTAIVITKQENAHVSQCGLERTAQSPTVHSIA